jgi:hypothetical protein
MKMYRIHVGRFYKIVDNRVGKCLSKTKDKVKLDLFDGRAPVDVKSFNVIHPVASN